MYKFKTITATPEQSLINPTELQITETNDEYISITSSPRKLEAMPVGSKGVMYRNGRNGYFPVQGWEHTEECGVRPKDVKTYHEQFIK